MTLSPPRATPHVRRRKNVLWAQVILHLALLGLLLLTLYPLLNMVSLSFKTPLQWTNDRWALTFPLRVENYAIAWNLLRPFLINTVFVGVVACALMLLLSSLSAFVFARMRFPGREVLYYAIIGLLMVPSVLSLVPAFVVYSDLGLRNTYWAHIIPAATGGAVFGVFLLRTFFAALPEDLFEAARIDGASILQQYWHICLPLSKPILGTLVILNLISTWNSFVWPSVAVQDDRLQVISVGLLRLSNSLTTAAGGDASSWGPLFAGYVIASLPLFLIFIFASRYYVEGLVSSGLKL